MEKIEIEFEIYGYIVFYKGKNLFVGSENQYPVFRKKSDARRFALDNMGQAFPTKDRKWNIQRVLLTHCF